MQMSFNKKDIEKLNNIKRNLPKKLDLPSINKRSDPNTNKKTHPVETEQDPEKLFKELMNVSPDGNVPTHLFNRLKEIENFDLKQKSNNVYNNNNANDDISYISFKQSLLEEEEN